MATLVHSSFSEIWLYKPATLNDVDTF